MCSENPSENDERYTEDDGNVLGNNENNNQDYRLSYSIPVRDCPENPNENDKDKKFQVFFGFPWQNFPFIVKYKCKK